MKDVLDWASMDSPTPPNYDALAAEASVVILRRGYSYFDSAHQAHRLAHDPVYLRDSAELRKRGVEVWDYCFPNLHAGAPSPTEQVANHFAVGGAPSRLTFLDVEFPGNGIVDTGRSAHEVGQLLLEFIAAFQAHGVQVGLYSSHVQMSDDNALNGALALAPELERTVFWQKVPYPVGAGKPRSDAYRPTHDDGSDYWTTPKPLLGAWLVQVQGDERDFHGVRQADRSYFRSARQGDSGRHILWARERLGLTRSLSFDADLAEAVRGFQATRGLQADGIIGPRTLAELNSLR